MAKGYPDYRKFSVPIAVVEGGTGTDAPTLAPGAGIEITGSWPNHTIINTSPASTLGDPVAVAHGGWGSADGTYTQKITVIKDGDDIYFDGRRSAESQPSVRLQRRAILFGPGGTTAPHMQLYHPSTGFVRLRNYSTDAVLGEALVFAIDSNPTVGQEATLCLHRGDEPNVEYLDFTNNGYPTDTNYRLRIQKRGTGSYRPFIFSFYDGTTETESWRVNVDGSVSFTGAVGMAVPLPVASGGTGRGAGALPVYANNAAAIAGGLAVGDFYRTGADPDPVCVVH